MDEIEIDVIDSEVLHTLVEIFPHITRTHPEEGKLRHDEQVGALHLSCKRYTFDLKSFV